MTITERSFILIDESSERIIVDDQLEKMLREEMRPILWFRDGLFCIMPKEILANSLYSINVYKKMTQDPFKIYLHWTQGLQVCYRIGIALSGLEQ